MQTPPLVVVGASAGGVEALGTLVRALPPDLPAAVLVVQHLAAHGPPVLPRILGRGARLPVQTPHDDEPLAAGRVYVAPPDRHLLVVGDRLAVRRGPRENRSRPALDPTFRSAAEAHGARVVGVVLTGNLDDGTAGLAHIRARGGITIAQAPDEAPFPSMPRAAIAAGVVDHVLPLAEIAPTIDRLARERLASTATIARAPAAAPSTPAPTATRVTAPRDAHTQSSATGGNGNGNGTPVSTVPAAPAVHPTPTRPDALAAAAVAVDRVTLDPAAYPDAGADENRALGGAPSGYSCPDCRGVLWEMRAGGLVRYRCRVGHAFAESALLHAQSEALEAALWSALVTLEEGAAFARRTAERAAASGRPRSARALDERARELVDRAQTIRQVLSTLPLAASDTSEDADVAPGAAPDTAPGAMLGAALPPAPADAHAVAAHDRAPGTAAAPPSTA